MRFSFKIFNHGAAKRVALIGVFAIAGSLEPRMLARPIEFSEPSNPTVTTNVSGLGAKPPTFPQITGSSRPSQSGGNFSQSLNPLPPRPNVPNPRNADRMKNWTLMTPDEMMQNMLERDGLKLPDPKKDAPDLDPSASLENLYLHRMSQKDRATNSFGAFALSGETNRSGYQSGAFDSYDPFGANSRKRSEENSFGAEKSSPLMDFFKSVDDQSPEALRAKKIEEDRLDAFRKTLVSPTVSAPPLDSPASRLPAYGGLSASSDTLNSPPGVPNLSPLPTPSAPKIPQAPAAPGQSSLTPYTAPIKPKAVGFSAPQRTF